MLFEQFKAEFVTIITDGGMLMIPLTALALTIYFIAFRLIFFFREHPFYRTRREKMAEYVFNPILAKGELGEMINYTQAEDIKSLDDIRSRFAEIRSSYIAELDGRRGLLLTLVTTAPLMGLLGTVMGMLTTFSGLAVSTAGSTVDQIAAGISEALITTQTGLIIAIPAYVMATFIQKRRTEMDGFITNLETLTLQLFEKSGGRLTEETE